MEIGRVLARVSFAIGLLTALVTASGATRAQSATGTLQVRVTIDTGDGATTPVPRHALLVSDTPPSRAPWRVRTTADGTGTLTLPPGTYVVESEEPLAFRGKSYEWRQSIDVAAGAVSALELTATNATIETASAAAGSPDVPAKTDPWDLLVTWEASIVPLWTPTAHASSVVLTSDGLLATAQGAIGTAAEAQAQLGPTLRVTARVLASDAARGVAILQVNPTALGARTPLPFRCADPPDGASVTRGLAVSAISTPLRRAPSTTKGLVSRLEAHGLMVTGDFPIDSTGGPVFASDGRLVGLTTRAQGYAHDPAGEFGAASRQAVCEVLRGVQAAIPPPPSATPLPPEPATLTEDALREGVKRRTGSLQPYRVSSSGFDVEFITPETAFAGLQQSMDFGAWTAYVADRPAALLVRVTPRQVESLWLKVARGAAMTQGIALPPITHFEPGFARLEVQCGDTPLTPIHPFTLERRVSEKTAIREGLYVFAPEAIGPHCGTVRLGVYSEKAPDKREDATVDAKALQQLWQDLAPSRAATAAR